MTSSTEMINHQCHASVAKLLFLQQVVATLMMVRSARESLLVVKSASSLAARRNRNVVHGCVERTVEDVSAFDQAAKWLRRRDPSARDVWIPSLL